ncbi:hypothetical protein D3C77_764480 [compost metagenome]
MRNLEKGEYSPTIATVRDLCAVLGVSMVTLASLVEAEFTEEDPVTLLASATSELSEVTLS